MVGGYNELTPPGRYYRGPITGTTPTYGHPYMADDHCASCGSTDVSKPSYKDGAKTFKCNRCGRRTRLANAATNNGEAVYEIRVNGYAERESLRRYDVEEALWDVLVNLDAHYASEKAAQYYGSYYDRLMDGDSADQGEALALDSDIMWINKDLAQNGGYVSGLEVGEEYNLPDFPVTIARLGDRPMEVRRPSRSASKPKTSSRSVKTGRSPAKTSKPKAPAKKKTPAKKPAARRY